MTKRQELANLIRKYEPYGIWKANELLLKPDKALMLANEIGAAGIAIEVVSTWKKIHFPDGQIGYLEDLAMEHVLNSEVMLRDDAEAKSVELAMQFLKQLPKTTEFVSFTLNISYS